MSDNATDLAEPSSTALASTEHPGWFHPQSLNIDDNLTFDEWSSLEVVQQLAVSSRWWLGDWANYGEFRFGNEFYQGIDNDVIEIGHLTECMTTCAEFPPDERRAAVSFDHHKLIAYKIQSLDERQRWLDRCEREKLTVATLAKEIKDAQAVDVDEADEAVNPKDPPTYCTVRVSLRLPFGEEAKARLLVDNAGETLRAMFAKEGHDVTKVEAAVSH